MAKSARSSPLPTVVVNMAVSLDGRITTRAREHVALGSERDRRLMDELRTRADAVIVGAGTVRHDGHPIVLRYADLRARRAARRGPHPVNVVLSRALDLPLRSRFFASKDTRRIVFTTTNAPKRRVRAFERVAEVIVLPGKDLSPRRVLSTLVRRGYRRVLLEGGGEVHFAFAKAGLVGEVYVTVTPRLIGGKEAPSLLDGEGFLWKDHMRLRLVSVKRAGEEVFLRYRVLASTNRPARRARVRRP
ncbi:MAG TPA: dihydrofolate reductase family protein [Candidatus Krumholzibacteria bacterium]|nr:dihydrofolate reductase family protein [Candidatus Krumholzibacteria bacterium]